MVLIFINLAENVLIETLKSRWIQYNVSRRQWIRNSYLNNIQWVFEFFDRLRSPNEGFRKCPETWFTKILFHEFYTVIRMFSSLKSFCLCVFFSPPPIWLIFQFWQKKIQWLLTVLSNNWCKCKIQAFSIIENSTFLQKCLVKNGLAETLFTQQKLPHMVLKLQNTEEIYVFQIILFLADNDYEWLKWFLSEIKVEPKWKKAKKYKDPAVRWKALWNFCPDSTFVNQCLRQIMKLFSLSESISICIFEQPL